MRTSTLTVILAGVLSACAPSHYVRQPARTKAPNGAPVQTEANAKITTAKTTTVAVSDDHLHFAKDGKCADGLVEAYAREAKLRHDEAKHLARNINAFEQAKRERQAQLERWREPIKAEFLRVRDRATPFNETYGSFACPKRADGTTLSSDALNADLEALTKYVENEVGPLPVPKRTKLKE